MKNKILYFLVFSLLIINCSNESQPESCVPVKAVELLINNPRIGPSKTETGYYEIVGEDEKFIYFGYQSLSTKSGRKLSPYFKTEKKEYYSVLNKTSKINQRIAKAIIKKWYLEKYPELNYDSINIAQTIEIKFKENRVTKNYDVNCFGWIEFYYSRMEKSTEAGIDSTMTNYKIKRFDYSSLITNGKDINWIKSK